VASGELDPLYTRIINSYQIQYATAHIDAQILILRDFIASLQNPPSPSTSTVVSSATPLTEHHLKILTSIRRDVVDTIRQVVDVVSKYAGGALPEPARTRVRSFILCLPQRWAHAATGTLGVPSGTSVGVNGSSDGKKDGGVGSGRGRGRTAGAPYTYGPGEAGPSQRSRPASRATSPSSLRMHPHGRQSGSNAVPTAGAATQAAQKILTLATESLDMLRAVTGVFKESLDKADA
jgi:transcriptional repressor OPI1